MDKYPVRDEACTAGEMTAAQEGLYTVFSVSCRMRPGLWCAWAVGETGEALRIGVLEPQAGRLRICRRFSRAQTAPLGPLREGRLRPLGEQLDAWEPLGAPAEVFQSPLLQTGLAGRIGVLTCRRPGGLRCVAVPRDDAAPFPIEAMFCFAVPRQLGAQGYWVFTFDSREWPVLDR